MFPLLIVTFALLALANVYAFRSSSELSVKNFGRTLADDCRSGEVEDLREKAGVLDGANLRPPTTQEIERSNLVAKFGVTAG